MNYGITWDELPEIVDLLEYGDPAIKYSDDCMARAAAEIDRMPTAKKENEFVTLEGVMELYGRWEGELVWMALEIYRAGQMGIADMIYAANGKELPK